MSASVSCPVGVQDVAEAFEDMGQIVHAIEVNKQLLGTRVNDKDKAQCKCNIARLYKQMGNHREEMKYLKQAFGKGVPLFLFFLSSCPGLACLPVSRGFVRIYM
jgi:hypothetical protein